MPDPRPAIRLDPDSAGALAERLQRRDPALWPDGNVSAANLGWLDSPRRMVDDAAELAAWGGDVTQSTVVLLGSESSCLGPAVLHAVRPPGGGGRQLVVCDTTHPATVARLDLSDALVVVVSSTSDTTLGTSALLAHAWSRMPDPSRYAVVTGPGTPLAELARRRGFRRVFEHPPGIGSRYSVLSCAGMVPAALVGYDVAALCQRALDSPVTEAAALGMTMGEEARAGRDKVTVVVPQAFRTFGQWVEQLVAGSTGKRGTGCVPVPTTEPEEGPDRHVVPVHLDEPEDLGEQFFRWEVAAAVCAHVLGVDPFDEPDVAGSTRTAERILAEPPGAPIPTVPANAVLQELGSLVRAGDYVSLQAYLPLGHDDALERLRRRTRDRLGGVAVTAGYGPRLLDSVGQLHKGGPNTVVAVQLVSRSAGPAIPVPDHPYDFATLVAAQADGDHRSLVEHGRRVLRVAADDPDEVR